MVDEIRSTHETGRPILVGTPTVEVSEVISRLLKRAKIPHNVLNARRHAQEAEVIARAGERGAITIATNMAGRGTDIKLAEGIQELGGLRVIGAARHDARRIDRQLRGRCARQGDPGSTVFFISLEDKLMRLFGSEKITGILERLGMKDGEELQSPMLTRVIEKAQKRVEQQSFSQRKRTLEYDDVMNMQRNIIYGLRKDILTGGEPKARMMDILRNTLEYKVNSCSKFAKGSQTVDQEEMRVWLSSIFPISLDLEKLNYVNISSPEELVDPIYKQIVEAYDKKESLEDPERIEWHQQYIMLTAIDSLWKDHLHAMDHLRQSVAFSHMAQKDPLVEYKQQAFRLFDELEGNISTEVLNNMFRSATTLAAIEEFLQNIPMFEMSDEDIQRMQQEQALQQMQAAGQLPEDFEFESEPGEEDEERFVVEQVVRETPKVGRNDSCPCGSGKKYKKCCGS